MGVLDQGLEEFDEPIGVENVVDDHPARPALVLHGQPRNRSALGREIRPELRQQPPRTALWLRRAVDHDGSSSMLWFKPTRPPRRLEAIA